MEQLLTRYVIPGAAGCAIAIGASDLFGSVGVEFFAVAIGIPWAIYNLFIWKDPIAKDLISGRSASDSFRREADPRVNQVRRQVP
jgi:hypothetical protein